MRLAVLLGLVCGLLAGCGDRLKRDRMSFDGQVYRSSAKKADDDRRNFVVQVRPVSASFAGAQQAGQFEGTVYCVENYGSSAIDWQIGPDQEPDSYAIENDTLVLRGTCTE